MKKRYAVIACTLALCLGLSACGGEENNGASKETAPPTESQTETTPVQELTTQSTEPAPFNTEALQSTADLGVELLEEKRSHFDNGTYYFTDTTEDGKSPFSFTTVGNLTLIDDFLQIEVPGDEETEQVEKQFITVQSKNGNTFYIVIDRNGETENVYFLNLVDEADLMALMESEEGETEAPTCSCTDKCVIGAINTNCEICRTNMSECTGKEPVVEPEQPTEPVEEPDEKKSANFLPLIIVLIAGTGGFAVYWFKFRKPKAKTSGTTDLDDYDF
jgi:hypothetical protein